MGLRENECSCTCLACLAGRHCDFPQEGCGDVTLWSDEMLAATENT